VIGLARRQPSKAYAVEDVLAGLPLSGALIGPRTSESPQTSAQPQPV